MHLIHFFLRMDVLAALDDSSGHAHHRGVRRHFIQNDAARADFAVVSDVERPQHLRAGTDHDVIADGGMALAVLFAGTAERHALIHGHVIADNRRFPDDNAVSVVDEKPFAELCAGVNLDAGLSGAPLRNPACQEIMFIFIKSVRHLIVQQHLETGIEQHFQVGMNGRIPISDDADFFSDIRKQSHMQPPFFISYELRIRKITLFVKNSRDSLRKRPPTEYCRFRILPAYLKDRLPARQCPRLFR